MGEFLKEHGNLKTQENQIYIYGRSLQNHKKVSNNSETTLYIYFSKENEKKMHRTDKTLN